MYGHPGMRGIELPARAFLRPECLRELIGLHHVARYAYRQLRFAVFDGHGGYVDAS
jgi:hypothetical protein